MFKMGLTVQPYIIGVGNKLEEVDCFYVIVDKIKFKFDSPLKALDTCFKIFFAWHAEFAPESKQVLALSSICDL